MLNARRSIAAGSSGTEGGSNSDPDTARMMEAELDDEAILRLIQGGDINAYSVLVRRYERYVMAILLRHIGGTGVEEICHDVFVGAYESLHTYKGEAPFRFWLSSIAVRRCYAYWRERKRAGRELPAAGLSPEAAHWCEQACGELAQGVFLSQQSQREARAVVGVLLQGLSAEDRLVIGLVHLEERPVKEVAAMLGWSVSNVKVRAYRARKIMEKRLREIAVKEGQ